MRPRRFIWTIAIAAQMLTSLACAPSATSETIEERRDSVSSTVNIVKTQADPMYPGGMKTKADGRGWHVVYQRDATNPQVWYNTMPTDLLGGKLGSEEHVAGNANNNRYDPGVALEANGTVLISFAGDGAIRLVERRGANDYDTPQIVSGSETYDEATLTNALGALHLVYHMSTGNPWAFKVMYQRVRTDTSYDAAVVAGTYSGCGDTGNQKRSNLIRSGNPGEPNQVLVAWAVPQTDDCTSARPIYGKFSDDAGGTWPSGTKFEIAVDPTKDFFNPFLLRIDATIYLFMNGCGAGQGEGTGCHEYESISTDYGRTWSTPTKLPTPQIVTGWNRPVFVNSTGQEIDCMNTWEDDAGWHLGFFQIQ